MGYKCKKTALPFRPSGDVCFLEKSKIEPGSVFRWFLVLSRWWKCEETSNKKDHRTIGVYQESIGKFRHTNWSTGCEQNADNPLIIRELQNLLQSIGKLSQSTNELLHKWNCLFKKLSVQGQIVSLGKGYRPFTIELRIWRKDIAKAIVSLLSKVI